MVPILRLEYDLRGGETKTSFRLMLVKLHSGQCCALGYRFESGAGTHAYFHCQLIRGFDKGDQFDSVVPEWIPMTQPAFCLDARGPVQLLAACFISMYGLTDWAQQLSTDQRLKRDLQRNLKEMHVKYG